MSISTQAKPRIVPGSSLKTAGLQWLARIWTWTTVSTPVFARVQRPYRLVLATLFIAAIGIGWSVLPGEIERIAALEQDGQRRRAQDLLEARFARGDRDIRVLAQLTRFYEVAGDTASARRTLELMAEQRPRDGVIQRQLAALYKSIQDEPAYIASLRRQIALRYAETPCRELIGLLRRSSQFDAEQSAIRDCRNRGYRRADDLVRLAFLEAADGRMLEAAQVLRLVDDRVPLRDRRERLLMFAALIDTKQEPEAARRGTRWLRAVPDEDLAIDLVYKFVEIERSDLGVQLATAVSRPGDAVALTVGEIMIERGQAAAAKSFLAGWLPQNREMDAELAGRFVAAAIDAGDPGLGFRGVERSGLGLLEPVMLRDLGEALMAAGLLTEFDRVRDFMGLDAVRSHPMLAAAQDLRSGRADLARGHLMRVRPDELDDRRLQVFVQLVDQAGRSPALAAVLRDERIASLVPTSPGRPPIVVGPATAQAKKRLKQRQEANKRLRDKRRADRVKADTPSSLTPIPFPKTE